MLLNTLCTQFYSRKLWVQIPVLPLTSCMKLSKLIKPHLGLDSNLWNGDYNSSLIR